MVKGRKLVKSKVLELDMICRRYGQLPSNVVKCNAEDYQFNHLVAVTGLIAEAQSMEKSKSRMKGSHRGTRRSNPLT